MEGDRQRDGQTPWSRLEQLPNCMDGRLLGFRVLRVATQNPSAVRRDVSLWKVDPCLHTRLPHRTRLLHNLPLMPPRSELGPYSSCRSLQFRRFPHFVERLSWLCCQEEL